MFTTDMSKALAPTTTNRPISVSWNVNTIKAMYVTIGEHEITIEIITITIGEYGITIEATYITICEHGITVETVTVTIGENMIAVEVVRTSLYTFFIPVWDLNIASRYSIEHVVVGYDVTVMRTEVFSAIMFV